jgi:CoA:oxalate CoA-transferase
MRAEDQQNTEWVIETASGCAGAYAGRQLAEAGLPVLRIEPEDGGTLRQLPPFDDRGMSIPYLSLNGRKQVIRIDMSDDRGSRLFADLIARSSVFITDTPRHFPARSLRVTCHIHPSPVCFAGDLPSTDILVQAASGALSMTGPLSGPPSPIGIPVGDIAPGLFAAIGILHGLLEDTPQAIEVHALDATIALLSYLGCSYLVGGGEMGFVGTGHPYVTPYGAYRAKDGHIIVAPGFTHVFWQNLCRMLGRPDLIDDPRFGTLTSRKKHRDALQEILDAAFMQDTVESWERRLNEADVPNGRVQRIRQAIEHPVMEHRNMVTTVEGRRFFNSPLIQNTPGAKGDGRTAQAGNGWRDILTGLGVPVHDIAGLESAKVITPVYPIATAA